MESEGVLMPLIHEHPMMPFNDLRKGDCCLRFEVTSDGYYCQRCDFFVHKKCGEESPEYVKHLSHPDHTLKLVSVQKEKYRLMLQHKAYRCCNLCGKRIKYLFYRCPTCKFNIDLCCVKYPPPEVIDISEMHQHKLTLIKKRIKFSCDAKCGNDGVGFSYKCRECDLAFHLDCVWHPTELQHPLEVNHFYHSLHPLKLNTKGQLPDYSDGTCLLCGRKVDDEMFYHCSLCNFTVDMRCVLNPPLQSLLNLKAHDHQLILLPRLDSFTCNACDLIGDRSPYICFKCGFMIHQRCLQLPRIININRHDHRVSRTSVLGVVNSVCSVCHKKVDWTRGGFFCQICLGYVVHSKCATRKDVWNGKELEGIPEETEDIEPYVVIDANTIQHFSHKEHHLRLHVSDVLCDDNKRCRACTHPICLQSYYDCIECNFVLHQNCAGFLRVKRHFLHNDRLSLVTYNNDGFVCEACGRTCNGFMYKDDVKKFDVRCVSISEPFSHPSHPYHHLYHSPSEERKRCHGCKNMFSGHELRCIEDDCDFFFMLPLCHSTIRGKA